MRFIFCSRDLRCEGRLVFEKSTTRHANTTLCVRGDFEPIDNSIRWLLLDEPNSERSGDGRGASRETSLYLLNNSETEEEEEMRALSIGSKVEKTFDVAQIKLKQVRCLL